MGFEILKKEQKLLTSNLEGNKWVLHTNFESVGDATEMFKKRLEEAGWSDDDAAFMEIGFREAMANAVLHGNLGISSSDKAWSDTVREELERHPEKMKKKVIVEIDITRKRVQVKITDEGEGFEASQVPNPTDSANLMKTTGRGIFYMKSFFDTVKHEGKGNITILSKERK